MQISSMNWKLVEAYLKHDDRCVLPIGSTEQHAYLSLSTDSLLAERVAVEATMPLGVPVFPVVHYGVTPLFMAYPGTITIRPSTLNLLITDIIDSLLQHGFKKVLIVNGHGGNMPLQQHLEDHYDGTMLSVKFHNWWRAPRTWAAVMSIDPVASHASWMENFPWTRLAGIIMPDRQKPMVDAQTLKTLDPAEARQWLGDGNYGGRYQREDTELMNIWETAVQETKLLLEEGW